VQPIRRALLFAMFAVLAFLMLGGEVLVPGALAATSVTGNGALAADSLLPPAADQLFDGEGSRAARAARHANPRAIAERSASRTAFEGLPATRAVSVTNATFPALDQTAGGVPGLAPGQHVVRYPTDHTAQISLPGGKGLIESTAPIAATTARGAHVPVDLRLSNVGGGRFEPVRSDVDVIAPSNLALGVALPSAGVSMTPVDRRGTALATSIGTLDGAAVRWGARERGANAVHDLTTLAKASPRGFDLSTLLFSQRSPNELHFRVGMPTGAHLRQQPSGAIWILKGRKTIATVSPVSAEDAEGTSVPATMSLSGNVISVHVDTNGDYLYPIAVDPEVNDSQLAKTSGGKRSGWEFKTNSAHFSSSEANGGPGAESLEAKASGGYGPSEYGFWGYQTKGVSHIYELKTETSAHNNGAKVESFLEFEEPSGAQETKKILSTPFENTEYEHKAATICAANASKVEQCLPGSGKANNAVHFQQTTTGSSATGFSDSMTQGIVSIAEPSGTHSATSYNTTSPNLEFEALVEGKKEKLKRANVLYGSGSWLSSFGGALAMNSSDPGIGVALTKLEYESSAGKWTGLFEHNYLGVENACQGVQCYSSHIEYATLPVGLPNGAQTIRYRAEEAISGTQSLEAEGQAKVKVDTKAPHNLRIEGLPYGDELSERKYELTVVATDGEGATPSSGVKSIALQVDGHEIESPTGSCTTSSGPCTASRKVTLNGAELGAGKHDIKIIALDNAGNEAHEYQPVTIKHSTPIALEPGSLDLQSGDFALGATDVSMGSGLTVGRNYSSRDVIGPDNAPFGSQWNMSVTSTESLSEIIDGSVILTTGNGKETIFAALGEGKFESPTGDSNLELTLEENKTTKQKLAYYLKDPAQQTSVKFTLPQGTSTWVPTKQEGTTASDTTSYSYQTGKFVEFSLPGGSNPQAIAAENGAEGKPDGNVWFTENGTSKIGKITPSGKVTEYASVDPGPKDIIAWGSTPYFSSSNGISYLRGNGEVAKILSGGGPTSITRGTGAASGFVWFVEPAENKVGKVADDGTFLATYSLPAGSQPADIVAGSDGNMWFTEAGTSKIGKVTEAGVLTEYSLPAGSKPQSIAAGPDGNLWFSEPGSKKLGKITTAGAVTEYALPTGAEISSLVAGPDQNLWYTGSGTGKVGKVTTAGAFSEYSLPAGSNAGALTVGFDGNLWFAAAGTQKIGIVPVSGATPQPTEELAPIPAGVSCAPELKPGCRALKFSYSTTTTATGEARSEWGEYQTRLREVKLDAYNPSSKAMSETAVAKYEYDALGRLRAEWDPRTSPALKTIYGYDEEGHLTALSPPGQEPWVFTYGTSRGDSGTGRLMKSLRAPASTALWGGELVKGAEAPSVSGSLIVGFRMSVVSNGKWEGSPLGYGYQWGWGGGERLSGEPKTCTPIPGATNASYTPVASDVNHELCVIVTATNAGGSATQTWYSPKRVYKPEWEKPHEVVEYALPSGSKPFGITDGTGANLWFTEQGTGKAGKITAAGAISEYSAGGSEPEGIVKAPDGNMWFVEHANSSIKQMTEAGTIVKTKILRAGAGLVGIASDHLNHVWYTASEAGYVGEATAAEFPEYHEYLLPTGSKPYGIAIDSANDAWFAEYGTSKVGEITTAGVKTEYALPAESKPYAITYGPDGKLWFTEAGADKVGTIATSGGAITEYSLPFGLEPRGIAAGSDGNLWVVLTGTGKGCCGIESVTTSGSMTKYSLPAGGEALEVAPGPEKAATMWFTEHGTNKIGKIFTETPPEAPATSPQPGTTINYNTPLSGSGAPAQMSAAEVAKWGQSDGPVEATSITPPDEPQSWPASSYKRATTYYLDAQGRQVNVASPSSSPNGAISTTEYNEYNDVIRTLTPGNRQTALEAGAASVEKSKLIDTQNTFNGEGAKEGEVAEPGTRLIESDGPQHKVTYVAGHEQKESLARLHSKFFYNEGAPGGETYDLQTKKSTLAQLSNEEEVEVRTTKTSYSGQSNLGWKLRAPTSVTSFGPEEAALSKSTTEYNSTTGQVTEVRGTSAETTMSYAKKFGEAGTEAGKLKAPWGDVVNAEGAILVVDSANNRIEKFSSEGVYVSSFGTLGSGNGQLKEPQGIALDSSGNVYVADTGNNRIEEFSSTGTFVKNIGSLGSESGKLKAPSDLAFDPKGNLWVADTGNSRIEKFNKEGVYVSEFGSLGTEPGKLKEPKGIAIDAGEHVWVADTANNRIQEFSQTGSLLKRFGAPGSGEGQLNTPIDLRIDSSGNLWTLDSKNNRAEAFTPTGTFVTQIGRTGSGNGQLSEPKGVAFDASGKAWVSDSNNNRMQQWSKGPNAHDQKTIYYSTAANSEYPSCGSHPEYAGLTCESLPAKQPELMGLPPLPTTTYAAYNIYNEPETITEAFGSSTRTKKEAYDAAGRRSTSETTATSGKSLPKVTFIYNSEQGSLEKESGEEKTLTSEYNRLGELTKYSDADGNTAKYAYAGPENDYLLTEASDSSSSGTSKQSYEYDPTTKLRTKLIDSSAGSFTAAYDTEGKLQSVSYPYGLCAAYSYNAIGEAMSLQYKKSSNCAEAEPGVYYSDSSSPSIRGEVLRQESTLANDIYSYDPSGRLSETQETPAGEGCTVRAYTYDEESNRATSSTRAPGTGGACQTEGGSTESHNYDEANRLTDPGIAYDAYGNVTKLPAADAEGHELSSTYYVDNAVATQTQNGITNEYKLDPEGRTRELISGATKTTNHYDGPGEAVSWSESAETSVRNIPGIDGTLLATQTNGATPVLQLHDLQGNVVATIGDKAGETKLLSTYNSTEFGAPNGKTPPKFAYLGAFGAESSLASGVITYGATSYVPQVARALQSEAVAPPGLPGGSGAGAPYTMQEEAWNMQGAAREAAEAPGLEAAREQAAFEAAEGTFVDPWVHSTMNRSKAASLAEEYWEAEAFAVVAAMNDIPTDAVEALGQKFGDFLSDFSDAYKWFSDAGSKLKKCAENKRKANGQAVNICWFEYEQIEWTPGANILGVQINLPVTLKFPNFSVEPRVNECLYVQGPSLACVANVYIESEL
jgi:streptogramin lyase